MSTTSVADGRLPDPELIAVARACLAKADSLDQAARAILERTQSPIAAIKALREAEPGLSLAEAKPIVDRCLPLQVRRANERLRDSVIAGMMTLIDSADGLEAE